MHENLEAQMMASKALPTDYLARVEALEQIPHVVAEIVLDEMIYNNPPPPQ